MLAVIGRDWLTIQDPERKTRRLDNPGPIPCVSRCTTALESERIRVIPVLVGRGVMPKQEDLPGDFAKLHFRNALELSDTRWESDVKRLIQAIEEAAPTPVRRTQGPGSPMGGRLQATRAVLPQLNHESHQIELIPTDPANLTFTGAHHKRLAEAFEKAFPTYQESGDDGPVPASTESRERGGAGEQVELRHIRAGADAGGRRPSPPAHCRGARLATRQPAARPRVGAVRPGHGDAAIRAGGNCQEQRCSLRRGGMAGTVGKARAVCLPDRCANRCRDVTRFGISRRPDPVLTNHHVIAPAIALGQGRTASADKAADPSPVIVRFDYKALDDGTTIHPGLEVGLAEDWLLTPAPTVDSICRVCPRRACPIRASSITR